MLAVKRLFSSIAVLFESITFPKYIPKCLVGSTTRPNWLTRHCEVVRERETGENKKVLVALQKRIKKKRVGWLAQLDCWGKCIPACLLLRSLRAEIKFVLARPKKYLMITYAHAFSNFYCLFILNLICLLIAGKSRPETPAATSVRFPRCPRRCSSSISSSSVSNFADVTDLIWSLDKGPFGLRDSTMWYGTHDNLTLFKNGLGVRTPGGKIPTLPPPWNPPS